MKLTNPDDVCEFRRGEGVSIDDLPYEDACAIFGRPMVDSYLAVKAEQHSPRGVVTVVGIGRGVLTLDPVRK